MRVALMTEPQQGLTYLEILAVARAAETAGLEGFFRSDHFTSFPGPTGEHTTDAWATLAGLARETSRLQLGALVSPVTFRIPGSFVKLVTTVDEMSGGRVEIGVGAGWNETEHAELGIPYPVDAATRVDMMEEQLAILVGLLDEPDGWSYEGTHWQVGGSLFRPRYDGSVARADGRRRPSIIVGGVGKPRSIRLAVRYADEYNVSSSTPDQVADINGRIDAACAAVGRDPGTIRRSVMAGVLIGRDEAELRTRVAAQVAMFQDDPAQAESWMEARRDRWVVGTLDAARARMAEYAAAGVDRVMLQDFVPRDLDHVALMSELVEG
jgi:alkanesulfonate monooxygenase SsuD/methylene tetrahydromethanopterin reductase-like flavin-dependent oxidoreductase (luciferase family)